MSEWIRIAGWVLIHFAWQGSVVVMCAAAALRMTRQTSAECRYAIACAALGVMLAFPPLTATVLASGSVEDVTAVTGLASIQSTAVEAIGSSTPRTPSATARALESYFPSFVSIWLAGSSILLVRAYVGWLRVRTLHRHALRWPSSRWESAAHRLATRMQLARPVRVVDIASMQVPAVLGVLRPVILMPLAAVSQLSPQQIEAILAHELAHIRRHDYLVNLLQSVAEAVLFYHPCVWWLSARIREEREHCCDAVAVGLCGDPDGYATALFELESHRTTSSAPAVAATDGPLLNRVRRVLGTSASRHPSTPNGTLVFALVAIFAVAAGGPQHSPELLAQATTAAADRVERSFASNWADGRRSGAVASEGAVVFSEDLSRVESVADGGFVNIETGGMRPQRVEVSAHNGTVTRRYFVSETEQSWNAETDDWLRNELPFLVRRSGVGAEERVRQLASSSGIDAVLAETTQLYTDMVRGRYFRALFETVPLSAADAGRALTRAADMISSSAELARTLRTAASAGFYSNEAFFQSVARISSSMEKARVLMKVLEAYELDHERQLGFLAAAAEIESNAQCAAVLDAFVTRYGMPSEPVRTAFLGALATVDSTAEVSKLQSRIAEATR